MFNFRAQFKDMSYAFCATLYGLINDNSLTHKRSFEGFHIKAEKLYKSGMFFLEKDKLTYHLNKY